MYMNKEQQIKMYSNPKKVLKNLHELFPNEDFEFKISTRKDKKYMVKGEFTNNKWVHFGQMGYEDYTHHKDEIRRDKFITRNWKWGDRPPNTPSYLSFHVLW